MAKSELKFQIKSGLDDQKILDEDLTKPEFLSRARILFEKVDFTVDLKEELNINERDLISSMVKHAGNFGWWASLHTTAKRALRKIKKETDKKRCELDQEARSSLKESGLKVTEEAVRAWLGNDPRMTQSTDDAVALEDIVEFTDTVLRALEHKRDMLKEINRAQCNENFNLKD